jgi:transcriptional regulator with XRE-family HTH domain
METIQERLKIVRKSLGLSQDELAIKTGAKRTTIAGYEAGVSLPHAEFLTALNKNYGINSNWLLTGDGNIFIKQLYPETEITSVGHQIPLLRQKVSCGFGQHWENEANIDRYVNVFDLVPRLKTGKVYAVSVNGSSMLGVGIRHGDIVLFDAAKETDSSDGIYVFALDGDVYCKRLEFDALTRQIKVYSVRVADLEKAELAMSFKVDDPSFADRLQIFGRVFAWIHPENQQE